MNSQQNDGDNTQMTQKELDHHANQLNPNNQAYQDRLDNRSDQLNPNNQKYEKAQRGNQK